MKCFYAIPAEQADSAKALCIGYAESLKAWSRTVTAQADDLRAFVDNQASSVLELDDADWLEIKKTVAPHATPSNSRLFGEIFWSLDDIRSVGSVLEHVGGPLLETLGRWLTIQFERKRSVVIISH